MKTLATTDPVRVVLSIVALLILCPVAAWADVPEVIARVKPSVVIIGTFKPT